MSVYTKLKQQKNINLAENTREWNSSVENSIKHPDQQQQEQTLSDDDGFYMFFYVKILTKLADVAELTFHNQEQFVDQNQIGKYKTKAIQKLIIPQP